jgi:hypothetical protein
MRKELPVCIAPELYIASLIMLIFAAYMWIATPDFEDALPQPAIVHRPSTKFT